MPANFLLRLRASQSEQSAPVSTQQRGLTGRDLLQGINCPHPHDRIVVVEPSDQDRDESGTSRDELRYLTAPTDGSPVAARKQGQGQPRKAGARPMSPAPSGGQVRFEGTLTCGGS
jgi:hypothetical protein